MSAMMETANGQLLDLPETLFVIRSDAPAGVPIDAIECAVSRAQSILTMVSAEFNKDEPCQWSPSVIANALWAVEGILEQIRILANNPVPEISR